MKKLISMILCVVLVMGVAAGCGQEPAPAESPSASAEVSASPSAEDTASGEPREAELNIMMSFPQYMDQWQTYADQFAQKMLDEQNIKATVNLEMPSSDQYESVLQARLTGDDAPDLYTIHCNILDSYNEGGYVTDLSSQEFTSKLYDDVKNTVKTDGKVLALPIESQAWGVLYNKAIFEDCGLKVPNTLDELANACTVLKEKGYTPFELAFQEQWVPQLMTALTLGGYVSGTGTDWLERMYSDEGSYSEVGDIFNVIDLIMENGTDRAMETGNETGGADFANGKAAMWVQGTWSANTIMEVNPDMQLGVFALPVTDDKACTLINYSTSTTLVVCPQSEEMELALAFVNYVLDDNDSSALFESCGFNPIASCHNYEVSSWVKEATAFVEAGRSYEDLVLPNSVTDEQGKLLQEYYTGNVTKESIIQQLDAAFKEANALK